VFKRISFLVARRFAAEYPLGRSRIGERRRVTIASSAPRAAPTMVTPANHGSGRSGNVRLVEFSEWK
jgi:hypothetical protein